MPRSAAAAGPDKSGYSVARDPRGEMCVSEGHAQTTATCSSTIDKKVRNFYSVSISGYHIAEAGANPISQLAFTLANGFTYVEYYLSRGMDINAFAPNLSFFFSNGMDPEYAVMGRVARRWGASEFAGQMP